VLVSDAFVHLYNCTIRHTLTTMAAASGGAAFIEHPRSTASAGLATPLADKATLRLTGTVIDGAAAQQGGAVSMLNGYLIMNASVIRAGVALEFGGGIFAAVRGCGAVVNGVISCGGGTSHGGAPGCSRNSHATDCAIPHHVLRGVVFDCNALCVARAHTNTHTHTHTGRGDRRRHRQLNHRLPRQV